jgi:hypothetical protein
MRALTRRGIQKVGVDEPSDPALDRGPIEVQG